MKRLLDLGRNKSGAFTLNFVAQKGKTFVMDNHLAALWCWLQRIDVSEQYNLFHIDRHYDLSDAAVAEIAAALQANSINIGNIPISELTAQTFVLEGTPRQSFRWDNYFGILKERYPDLLTDQVYFATHKYGSDGLLSMLEKEPYDLPENLGYWIKNGTRNNNKKWIVNLDIDYFFLGNPHYDDDLENEGNAEMVYQFLKDEFVRDIAEEIGNACEDIAVLTIALSPECCGGWDNSVRIANILTTELGLVLPEIN
jgi:hypothetical protein